LTFANNYTILVEANHLFKAGAHHQRKIKIQDVVAFAQEKWINAPAAAVRVLYGTYDVKKPNAFLKAVRIAGYVHVQVPSIEDPQLGKFFDVATVLDEELCKIPNNSGALLLGFHHLKFLPAVKKHSQRLKLRITAFTTASNAGGFLSIPREMSPYVEQRYLLDFGDDSIIGTSGFNE
jgi:hypothetical protein